MVKSYFEKLEFFILHVRYCYRVENEKQLVRDWLVKTLTRMGGS